MPMSFSTDTSNLTCGCIGVKLRTEMFDTSAPLARQSAWSFSDLVTDFLERSVLTAQEIEMGGSSVAIAAVQDAIARGMLVRSASQFLWDRIYVCTRIRIRICIIVLSEIKQAGHRHKHVPFLLP